MKLTIKETRKAMAYYDAIESYEERQKLQTEFGHENEPDREVKFYKWLYDNKL